MVRTRCARALSPDTRVSQSQLTPDPGPSSAEQSAEAHPDARGHARNYKIKRKSRRVSPRSITSCACLLCKVCVLKIHVVPRGTY